MIAIDEILYFGFEAQMGMTERIPFYFYNIKHSVWFLPVALWLRLPLQDANTPSTDPDFGGLFEAVNCQWVIPESDLVHFHL